MTTKRRKSTQAKRTGKIDRRERQPSKWAWLSSGFVVALIGLLGALIPRYIHGSPRPTPALELDSVSVESYAEIHPNSSPSGPVTLDFKVHNTGEQIAVITDVRIRVQQFMDLPLYQSQSSASRASSQNALPVSASYGFVMPLSVGGNYDISISDQVEPDQADRFQASLRLPSGGTSSNTDIYLYRVHLTLLYGGSRTLDAGEAIFSLPEDTRNSSFQNPASETTQLHHFLTQSGVRPPDM